MERASRCTPRIAIKPTCYARSNSEAAGADLGNCRILRKPRITFVIELIAESRTLDAVVGSRFLELELRGLSNPQLHRLPYFAANSSRELHKAAEFTCKALLG